MPAADALREHRLAISVLADAKRNSEALARQQRVLKELRAAVSPDDPAIVDAVEFRNEMEWRLSWGDGKSLEDRGDFDGAVRRHRTWLRERSVGGTKDDLRVAFSWAALGRCVSLAGRTEEGLQILQEGRARAVTELGRTHEATRWFLTEQAQVHSRAGDHHAEVVALSELHADEVAALGEDGRETILTLANLALAYDSLSEPDQARRFAELAISGAARAFGPDDPFTQRRRDALASLLPNDDDKPTPS